MPSNPLLCMQQSARCTSPSSASIPSSHGTVNSTMITALAVVDHNTTSGQREVVAISRGNISCWFRSTLMFHYFCIFFTFHWYNLTVLQINYAGLMRSPNTHTHTYTHIEQYSCAHAHIYSTVLNLFHWNNYSVITAEQLDPPLMAPLLLVCVCVCVCVCVYACVCTCLCVCIQGHLVTE